MLVIGIHRCLAWPALTPALGKVMDQAKVPLGGTRRRLRRHRHIYARKLRSFLRERPWNAPVVE